MKSDHTYTQTCEYRSDRDRTIVLEPWGDVVSVSAGQLLVVTCVALKPREFNHEIEFVEQPEGLAIWAWSGSTMVLTVDGKLAWHSNQLVPPTPVYQGRE